MIGYLDKKTDCLHESHRRQVYSITVPHVDPVLVSRKRTFEIGTGSTRVHCIHTYLLNERLGDDMDEAEV